MGRQRRFFQCQQCGHAAPKWLGRCPDCGAWNSFAEEIARDSKKGSSQAPSEPVALPDVASGESLRASTSLGELDRVLGGGVVPGSVILVGGSPGIGKSTLLLQCASGYAGGTTLYVSGEESAQQIKLRADRLRVDATRILLLTETTLEAVLSVAERIRPAALVVDSVQTLSSEDVESAPGSVSQVREVASRLMGFAKTRGIPVFIIGHVTKDGAIAGPRVLEHIVDTVLYFEGDRGGEIRILRTVKNRFGSTNEIGVFRMTAAGLADVVNPSEIFISEGSLQVPGNGVVAGIEGARPILAEVQALLAPSPFGVPRRTVLGLDSNRVNLILAVLERRCGVNVVGLDTYVSVVGGLRLEDTSVDLGVAVAAVSAIRDLPIPKGTVLIGEIGLSGELRAVARPDLRLNEAAKLGFRRVLVPAANTKGLERPRGIDLVPLATLEEAVEAAFL